MYDNFTSIPFRFDNLDRYYMRNSVYKKIRNSVDCFKGDLLDLGAGNSPYKNFILDNSSVVRYISVDIESENNYGENKPDFFWDGKKLPFDENSFDTLILTEVLEHVFDISNLLKEAYRVLRPGGMIFGTTPFLWTLHEVPYDYCRYTPFGLEYVLKNANFGNVEISKTGGWNASLALMLGLWVRRSSIGRIKRRILSMLLMPIIRFLISKDVIISDFKESEMITGLSFTAQNQID